MTEHLDGIQEAVEAATLAALAASGRRGIKKVAVLRPFLGGDEISRSTLYRWLEATIARSKEEAEEAARPKPKGKPVPKPNPVEAEVRDIAASQDAAAALARLVPEIESMEAAMGSGRGDIPVTAMLRHVVGFSPVARAHRDRRGWHPSCGGRDRTPRA